MAKTILGVDVGTDNLKLALVKGSQVRKAVSVPMPKNLVREGRVVSPETMGELIRSTMKENGIHASSAAYVLSNESTFIRNVTMPVMNAEQLRYNIPYEFNDYITDDLKNYVFDYAMVSSEAEEGMELMAVAAPVSAIQEAAETLRKAGLKLVKAAPAVSAFISLIRAQGAQANREYCILDLGYQAIRMYMFRGDAHNVTRILEIGLSSLDEVIADAYHVDVHLAHTYLLTNHEDCQNQEFCGNAYSNISVELMRAINFYRFSNPDSQLSDVWLCGGGAAIPPLRQNIADALDMNVHPASELAPGAGGLEDSNSFVQAVGITMD